jgi:hypothetical protein
MVYGSVRHEPDRANAGQMRSRYGGPLPLGSLPGAPEKEYQQIGLGKYRSMRTETEKADHEYEEKLKGKTSRAPTPLPARSKAPVQAAVEDPPGTRYDAEGNLVGGAQNGAAPTTTAPTTTEVEDDDPPF